MERTGSPMSTSRAGAIYDATIAEKSILLQQTIDFNAFSGGGGKGDITDY